MDVSDDIEQPQLEDLRAVAEKARRLIRESPFPSPLTDCEVTEILEKEIAPGNVIFDFDHNGFPPVAREAILGRIREYLKGFSEVITEFNARFQPFSVRLAEWKGLLGKIDVLASRRDDAIASEKARLDREDISKQYRETKTKYDHQVEIHPNLPNMKAVSARFPINPVYMLVLLCVGIAEFIINYDTLLRFWGIPAIALANAIIFALGLAMVSHFHGATLKQWTRKFGRATDSRDRPYGPLILVTFLLIVIIATVGWMRYQAVTSAMHTQNFGNLLGNQFAIKVNPAQEVIISLGANILVWLVGILFAYWAHDPDPLYVETALDYLRTRKKYRQARRQFERKEEQFTQKCKNDIAEQYSRQQKFEGDPVLKESKNLRDQVRKLADGLAEQVTTFINTQHFHYRNTLINSLAEHSEIEVFKSQSGRISKIDIQEYQTLDLAVPNEMLGNFVLQVEDLGDEIGGS